LNAAPSGPVTSASVRLCTGSNGEKCVIAKPFSSSGELRPANTAWSMVSLSSAREASAAARTTSAAGVPAAPNGSPRVRTFLVRVPVLSEQSTSTPASSSIADSRVTIACLLARRCAPTAMVTESTVGIATGIAATVRTRANCRVVRIGSPR